MTILCRPRPTLLLLVFMLMSTVVLGQAGEVQVSHLSVEVLTPSVETDPRTPTHLMVRFHNAGEVAIDLEPQWTLPEGWRWVVPPTAVQVPARGDVASVVSFLVPLEWPAGLGRVSLRADRGAEAHGIDVLVRAHSEFRVELLEAPSTVVNEPHELRFLISNYGNQDERLHHVVIHDPRFQVATDLAEVFELRAGANVTATVRVTPPATLARRSTHTVGLQVSNEGLAPTLILARAQVEVLPLAHQAPPRHSYDLRLRLVAGVVLDVGKGFGWGTGVAAPGLTLRGSGSLDAEGKRHLTVDAQADFVSAEGGATVRYETEALALAAGHHTVRFTPLLRFDDALGLSARAEGALAPGWSLAAHAAVLFEDGDPVLGAQGALSYGSRATLGLTVAQRADEPTLLGARLQLGSALGPFVDAELDVEALSLGLGSFATRVALDVDADPLSLAARWTHRVLDGYGDVRSDLSLRAGLRMPTDTLEDTPWNSVRYVAWFDRRDRSGSSATETSSTIRWGLHGDFQSSRVGTTVRYVEHLESGANTLVRRDFGVRFRLPFADGLDLGSRLVWVHSLDDTTWGAPEFDLIGILRFSSRGGRGSLQIGMGFEPGRARPEVEAAWRWHARFGESFRLTSGVDLRIAPDVRARLELLGVTQLPEGRELELGIAAGFRQDTTPTYRAHLALTVPISFALGPVGPSGEVQGRVLDDDGEPVVGVRARLADQVAITGEDGVYRFAALPVGDHHLTLAMPDTHTDRFVHPALPWPVTVEEGSVVSIDFGLARPAGMALSVVLEPTVGAVLPRLGGFRLRLLGPKRTHVLVTDDLGWARLDGLEPGRYRVEVDQNQAPFGYRFASDHVIVDALPGQTTAVRVVLRGVLEEQRIVDGGTLELGGAEE